MAVNPSIQLGTSGNWAIKEDNLLAYKQLGNKFFDREFDFSRGTTATFVGRNGLIQESAIDVPRIDFTDDTTGHLLLEPQSTNIIPYSEDFSNGFWAKRGASVTSGFSSPSGDLSAFKLVEDNSTAGHFIYGSTSIMTAGTDHSFSVRVKANEVNTIQLKAFHPNQWAVNSIFNLTTGIATSTLGTSKITELANGWFDISISGEVLITGTTIAMIYLNSDVSYTGDGTSGVYIWGAQLEALSYATSYIPTSGSTVTRNQESCNNSGTVNDFNSEEGVLYVEGSFNELFRLGISENASSSNRILIGQSSSSLSYIVSSAASPVVNSSVSGYQFNQNLKLAAKYKQNDFALWVNGIEVITVSSGNTPTGLNSLDLKGQGLNVYGNIKRVAVFKEALTDAELQELTT